MTRHEADRVHEASGIAFTFAGHLVWGNPVLSEGLHGDVESWRCGLCNALVVGDKAATDDHAEQHNATKNALVELTKLLAAVAEKLDRVDAQVRTQMGELADVAEKLDCISPGAFKPVEVPGAVLGHERRNPSATAHEMGADVQRMTRVARWRDAATVREVPAQLRADGLPE
jgi:hypothetical protein